MHTRGFEMVASSMRTIEPDEAGGHGSDPMMERLGDTQAREVKDKMPEFMKAVRWPSVEEIATRAPLPPRYRYQYLDRQQVPPHPARKAVSGIIMVGASCLREGFYLDKFGRSVRTRFLGDSLHAGRRARRRLLSGARCR